MIEIMNYLSITTNLIVTMKQMAKEVIIRFNQQKLNNNYTL